MPARPLVDRRLLAVNVAMGDDEHSPFMRKLTDLADSVHSGLDVDGVRPANVAEHESVTSPTLSSSLPLKPSSPPPRSSSDSPERSSLSKYHDSIPIAVERKDTLFYPPSEGGHGHVVDPSFDENVLRALCDLDVSVVRPAYWGSPC